MKKKLIATGCLIAILGLSWCGASWYTGKNIENNMDESLKTVVKALKEPFPDAQFRLTYTNYQRGIFSSTLTYKLQSVLEDAPDGYAETLHENEVTIFHGPFPLPQLKAFHLKPQLLSYLLNIESTHGLSMLKSLQEASQKEYPVIVQGTVDYSGNSINRFSIAPIQQNQGYAAFNFSGATVDLQTDASHFDKSNISADLGNMRMVLLGQPLLDLQNITFETQGDEKDKELTIKANKLELNTKFLGNLLGELSGNFKKTKVVLDHLSFSLNSTSVNDTESDVNIHYDLNQLKLNDQDLGKRHLQVAFKKVPTKVLHALFDNPNTLSGFGGLALDALFDEFIKNNGVIALDNYTVKTKEGESRFSFSIQPNQDKNLPIPKIKLIDIDLAVSLPMLADNLLAFGFSVDDLSMHHSDGQITTEKRRLVQSQLIERINEINTEFKSKSNLPHPFLVLENETVKFKFQYDASLKDVHLNGVSYPIQDFLAFMNAKHSQYE